MRQTYGSLIRAKRELLDLTRERVARAAGISAEYLSQIEIGSHVRVSDALALRLRKVLHMGAPRLEPLRAAHNDYASRWAKANRKKKRR